MPNPTVSRPLTPLYKVFLFGRFRIERRDPQGCYHSLPPDTWDRQSPRRVLTYLLLAPGRHSLKDPLLDVLCPDDELDRAQAVLSQALSLIRRRLVDEQGNPLLLPRKATPEKPLVLAGREIWCDWDEFQQTLMQAQAAEQQGGEALPVWEQAYVLCQEEFLLEERYSDWCREVRERAEGDQRLCLLHLAACYEQQGRSAEAERILRAWLSTHALDQDALCRLMEVLAEQGRMQEALTWYERTCEVLQEEGEEPDRRTQETMEWMRALQIQRKPVVVNNFKEQRFAIVPTSSSPEKEYAQKPDAGQIGKASIRFVTGEQHSVSDESMNPERRKLIKGIGVGLGATSLAVFLPRLHLLASIPEQLKQYQEQIPLYWDGYFTTPGQDTITAIENVIGDLQRLSSYTNMFQQEAIQLLLCQYHQLAADQLRDRGRINEALVHGDLAVYLAEQLQHVELLAAALYRRGLTYFDAGQIDVASRDLNDALPFARISRPQLKGMVYMEAGRFQAHLARSERDKGEATRLLDQTEQIVSQGHLEIDAGYVKLNQGRYHIGRAATLLVLKQPQEALQELEVAKQLTPKEYQRRHAYINILRARSYLSQRHYDQAAHLALTTFQICQGVYSESNIADITRLYKELMGSPFAQTTEVQQLGFQILQHQKGTLP